VVEAMGGSLAARRNSHGGSTFVVRLRRSELESIAEPT